MTRREFIQTISLAAAAAPALGSASSRSVKFAAITDVHFGLAPDAYERLEAFVEAVNRRHDFDFVIQLGDFCHAEPHGEADAFLELWDRIRIPKRHVLGNHDMDRCSKDVAMSLWGMPNRFYRFDQGDWRFLVLDLNHFRKEGKLHAYEKGNYFTSNATHNWADPAQLEWLESELQEDRPTLIFAHQPLGFAEPGRPLPAEQRQVLELVKGRVAGCVFGHLHVDRLEVYENIPCYCLNSASYFWQSGMHPYTKSLFAFFEIMPDGRMKVEGVSGRFKNLRPETTAIGCSPSIDQRFIRLKA